jgi:4-carboxymuconolactone decarboxylase
MTDERYERGIKVRREVLGDEHVDRAIRSATPFTAPFQEFITRTAWGDVWSRPGLDRRTRSCITLAVVTALRAEGEIEFHVRGALRNGLTPDEIAEVLLHTAVYAGVPAAHSAYAIAGRVLDEGQSNESNGRPT